MSEIADRVKAIIVDKLGVDEGQVTETAAFTTDLGADSLDLVEIVMTLEEEFDVKIDDSEIENLKKVGDIITYIEKN